MKLILLARNDDDGLAVYRALTHLRFKVSWFTGVFHDLWRHLPKGHVYLRRVDPANHTKDSEIVKVTLREFQGAFIQQSMDDDGHLDFMGCARPDSVATAFTLNGLVCIGYSRLGVCNDDLRSSGCVFSVAAEDLLDDLPWIAPELRRLVNDNALEPNILRVLTLRQPFGWAIFHAGKDMENRNWPAFVRGTVAIHVPSELPRGYFDNAAAFIRGVLRSQATRGLRVPPVNKLPKGAVIGLVDIVDTVSESQSPWFEGPLAFSLANPRPLPTPIPFETDKRRFFRAPAALMMQIRSQIPDAGI